MTLGEPAPRLHERGGSGPRESGVVGAKGFEPSTPASRTQCATGLRYAPTRRLIKTGTGLSYKMGVKRKPCASATPEHVTWPFFMLTPFAKPGSE